MHITQTRSNNAASTNIIRMISSSMNIIFLRFDLCSHCLNCGCWDNSFEKCSIHLFISLGFNLQMLSTVSMLFKQHMALSIIWQECSFFKLTFEHVPIWLPADLMQCWNTHVHNLSSKTTLWFMSASVSFRNLSWAKKFKQVLRLIS